ncbi:MAG: beta-ketoacyl synthase N-terminal-like domain-containing protein [Anaerolineae bacterium]
MKDVVVVSAARSPFGKFGGTLKDFTHPDLGGLVFAEAVRRADIDPSDVDEIAVGVNLPGSDRSIARQVAIKAGIPTEKVAYTVDRACCSSMAAINLAARSIRVGDAAIAAAGGAENMSRTPYFVQDARWGRQLGDIVLKDQLIIACPMTGKPRAVQAGEEAVEYGIGREPQDRWALRSHQRYFAARDAGRFADELFPIAVPQAKGAPVPFCQDESPRADTTLSGWRGCPSSMRSPTVTAGNAPGLNTGATAVILMSRDEAERRGRLPSRRLSAARWPRATPTASPPSRPRPASWPSPGPA